MQSTTVQTGRDLAAPADAPDQPPFRASESRLFALLGLGTGAVALAVGVAPHLARGPSQAAMGEAGVFIATLTALAVLSSMSRVRGAWVGTRLATIGMTVAAVYQAGGWLQRWLAHEPANGGLFGGSLILLLLCFLTVLGVDFFEHIKDERAELVSDILLVCTLAGAAEFLLQHTGTVGSSSLWSFTLLAATAAAAILVVVGWGVLALWCTTPIHLFLFGCATVLGGAAVGLDNVGRLGWEPASLVIPEAAAAASLLALTAVLVVEPRLNAGTPRPPRAVWWIRPSLMAISLFGACALVVAALVSRDIRLSVVQSVVLTVVVFATVGMRTLLNQIAMSRSARQLEGALGERETAIASLQSAAGIMAASEARLRLLLDAAVDGVVELDAEGTIVRANGAFCSMVHLPIEEVLGRRWVDMVRRSERAGDSLASLPDTGEAVISSDTGTSYLEARASVVPTTPPGMLLMIRDVTASKTAEQTIRTLFQFLQDRDEDRTRLLQRTNAAIEAERNRIARDLHDGPIQGISATTLSLEAIKLMMESGRSELALDTLRKVCVELGEEAMNLRRVMSDLRPPVLEERGLIPAVRELCDRWHAETDVPVEVIADSHADVASDLETLAYRVVQEALSNVKKHARASLVTVRIEALAGTLRVEIRDDGVGFDAEMAREFLKSGRVGLASMRERAELAGGTLTMKSSPGSGTSIMATLPFDILATTPGVTAGAS
jgi:PAS domain S-box-containing protein